MARLAPLLLLLAGCGGNMTVRGDWSGDCLLETTGGPRRVPFRLELSSQARGQVLGTGSYEFNGYRFTGDVKGQVDGDGLIFDLVGIYKGYTVTLSGDGELEDNGDIEGDCTFFDLEGNLDMEPAVQD